MIKLSAEEWHTVIHTGFGTDMSPQGRVVYVLSQNPENANLAAKIKALSPAEFAKVWNYRIKMRDRQRGKRS